MAADPMKKESKRKNKNKISPPKIRPQKRCIKRFSLKMNQGKWEKLVSLTDAMAREKDSFLVKNRDTIPLFPTQTFRSQRSELVAQKYKSPHGLQNRSWKLALKDAIATRHKYWLSLGAQLKEEVKRKDDFDKDQKRYCFWVLSVLKHMQEVLEGAPPIPTRFELEEEKRKACSEYLRELIEAHSKKRPRVKKSRSFCGEPETYRVFCHNDRQYVALAGLTPRKRLVIPLSGKGKIAGEVRVVLDYEKQRVEIHWSATVKPKKAEGKDLGVDIGVSEVMVDSEGERYGTEFGGLLGKCSEERKKKGEKRNKLYALEKKHRKRGEKKGGSKRAKKKAKKKAKKIRAHNLGRKKLRKKQRKRKIRLKEEVNRGLNKLLKDKKPRVVVCEDLSHFAVKCKGRKFSRLISNWIRGVIRDRIDFKCPQRGSLVKRVNPAYSSQICPLCGWVESKNRTGDVFACRFCGVRGYSDGFAAKELLRRMKEPSIFLWTRKEEVKGILLESFSRRLERWDFPFSQSSIQEETLLRARKILSTVPGKTPDP